MKIEKVGNGYVVKTLTQTLIYTTIEEVFAFILLHFEGHCKSFGGDSYGEVIIKRRGDDGR